ncbi:MAG TPA: Ig-like domain-containing protein, partial [Abditibacteriaceae bacterium]
GTLSGTAPNVTYSPNANYHGEDKFFFQANDGKVNSTPVQILITVNSVNDAPTISRLTVQTGNEDTSQGLPAHVVINGSDGADVDGHAIYLKIESLGVGTLRVNNELAVAGRPIYPSDYLHWIPPANATGLLTIANLRAFDGALASAQVVPWQCNLAPVNDRPTAQGLTVYRSEDTPYNGTLVGKDVENDPLTFRITQAPQHGTLSGTLPAFTYTPDANYTGDDSFQFVTNDGQLDSAPATILFHLEAKNDAPTLTQVNDLTGALEDSPFEIAFATLAGAADEADVDNDAIAFRIESIEAGTLTKNGVAVTAGTLFNVGDTLIWTAPADANGTDTAFSIKAWDGKLASATAVDVTIAVEAASDVPVAQNQSVNTSEDEPVGITLSAQDIDGDALTYSIVAQPQHGTLTGTAPNLTYTPNANYSGEDFFTFQANDGALDSNIATVAIVIAAKNDAPVAQNQTVTTNEDQAKAITMVGTDADGDALSYSIVTSPQHGTLSGSGANRTYTPDANYSGSDSFTFKVNDGTTDSNTATVSITVAPVNDAPVASDQATSTTEDTAKPIALSASDIDSDALTYEIASQPQHGNLSGTAPNLTYTPDANYSGEDSFTFKAKDGSLDSNIATVTIAIAAKNDAPVAQNQTVTTNEDQAKAILLGASDADGDALTFNIVAAPQHGALSGSGANRSYTPNTNYSGPDSFTYRVNDGTTDSNTATIYIIVTPVNDVPVASGQTVNTTEDTAKSIALSATDSEGEALSYTIVSQPQHGTLSGTAPNLIYTPNANYNGSDNFSFKANDGSADSNVATVSISISAVNDAPTLTTINTLNGGLEDTSFTISFATLASAANAADVEGSSLSFRIESVQTGTMTKNGVAVTAGTLLSAGESLSWKAAANANGTLNAFGVKAWDGALASSGEISVKVNVAAVNDAPGFLLNGTSLTVKKNAAAQSYAGWATNISVGPADESAQTKTFVVTNSNTVLFSAQPAISSTGTLTLTPAKNKTGTATVTVKLQDSGGTANGGLNTSTTQTFTIRIG